MNRHLRQAVAVVIAVVAAATLGPVGFVLAAALAGGLLVDACWQDKATELRNERDAERSRNELLADANRDLQLECNDWYARCLQAEGQAIAVDLVERSN